MMTLLVVFPQSEIGDDSTIATSASGNKAKRRSSLASSAPTLTRQLSQEEQENADAAALSNKRNKFLGDLTRFIACHPISHLIHVRKERRGSMLRVENGTYA